MVKGRAANLAFFVSSAMWPEASNPVMVPAVNRLFFFSLYVESQIKKITYNERIQFQAGDAPVPLSSVVIRLRQKQKKETNKS